MGFFGNKKSGKNVEILDKDVRELIYNLKGDLSPLCDGTLTIEIYCPEKTKHGHGSHRTVTLINKIPQWFGGMNPDFESVFSINDGKTGHNYIMAGYKDEEFREIIEHRVREYESVAGIKVHLEKYSQ